LIGVKRTHLRSAIIAVPQTEAAAMRSLDNAAERNNDDDRVAMWVMAFGILVGTYLAIAI
jgi:hypothetical protein